MNALRELREISASALTITIPKTFRPRMVEVIVVPMDGDSSKRSTVNTRRAARNLCLQQLFDESYGILPKFSLLT